MTAVPIIVVTLVRSCKRYIGTSQFKHLMPVTEQGLNITEMYDRQ